MRPPLNADLVRHALERVRLSREFRRAPGLQRFLTFLVETQLNGDEAILKESVIGAEVFHRAPGYDAKSDPIVRVEANRLRRKLAAYYGAEGAHDFLRIALPCGAYVPAIEPRPESVTGPFRSPPAKPTRLLVLPFGNLTGQDDQEIFIDGLTETVIHRFSGLPGLQTLGRTTSFALKGASFDMARLRERFDLDVLIEGGVRLSGDLIQVDVRFIAADSESCFWCGAFARRLEQALQLHDEIACALLRQLRLPPPPGFPAGAGRTAPPAVHEAFLLGNYFLHRWRPEQQPDPAGYFRRAIAADPTFAPAYCGLADCLYLQAYWAQASPAEILPAAVAAVERSLFLDSSLADAHCTLGILRNAFDWDSEACRASLSRCLELDHGHAAGRREFAAAYLTPLGRIDEARGWLTEARHLDPLSPLILFHLAQNAWFAGRHELAMANAAQAIELDRQFTPAHWILTLAATDLGRWDHAEAGLMEARTSSPPMYSATVETWVRAAQGRREEARRLLRELLDLRTREYCSDACLAFAFLGLGRRAQALRLMAEAIRARDPHLRLIGVAPVWRGLSRDPQWARLLGQVRLPTPDSQEQHALEPR